MEIDEQSKTKPTGQHIFAALGERYAILSFASYYIDSMKLLTLSVLIGRCFFFSAREMYRKVDLIRPHDPADRRCGKNHSIHHFHPSHGRSRNSFSATRSNSAYSFGNTLRLPTAISPVLVRSMLAVESLVSCHLELRRGLLNMHTKEWNWIRDR